jgi:hypothetical protein
MYLCAPDWSTSPYYRSTSDKGQNGFPNPAKPDDIVTLKTDSFYFRVKVNQVCDERFSGVIVECPLMDFIGNAVNISRRYIWANGS